MRRGKRMARAVMVAASLVLLCALLSACGLGPSEGDAPPDGPTSQSFPGSWQSAQAAPAQMMDYLFAPSNPQTGYACAAANGTLAAFTTTDGGASWRSTAPLPAAQGTDCQLFVDDDDASNLVLGWGAGNPQSGVQISGPRLLYRSRDGGRSWTALPSPPPIQGISSRNVFDGVAILGQRILASVRIDTNPSPNAAGAPTYALYALAADSLAWVRIDGAFTAQRLAAGGLLAAGGALLVGAYPVGSASGAGASRPPVGTQPLGKLFSGPVPGAQIWRSTDGGASWERVHMSFTHPTLLGFTRARDGSTYYGAGVDYGKGGLLYSADGGASWTALPTTTMVRSRAGQPVAMNPTGPLIAVAPDGSALATIPLAPASASDYGPAGYGVLRLQPGSSGARWVPLAAGAWIDAWHATPTTGGVRLWGLRGFTPQDGGELVFLDVPSGSH